MSLLTHVLCLLILFFNCTKIHENSLSLARYRCKSYILFCTLSLFIALSFCVLAANQDLIALSFCVLTANYECQCDNCHVFEVLQFQPFTFFFSISQISSWSNEEDKSLKINLRAALKLYCFYLGSWELLPRFLFDGHLDSFLWLYGSNNERIELLYVSTLWYFIISLCLPIDETCGVN